MQRNSVLPLAEKKGIELRVDIADDIGTVTTDQRRLEQVLLNLLNNAVKFTEKGHVHMSCRTENNQYLLSVSDTGIGIEPETNSPAKDLRPQRGGPGHGQDAATSDRGRYRNKDPLEAGSWPGRGRRGANRADPHEPCGQCQGRHAKGRNTQH
ncbi:MAG: HAMP domain-containing histidine kinase [Deltaproteobacteria bacterium]|nr:HAMP domain-containing histidine kinase [Deltaproteobacteria bacterium]